MTASAPAPPAVQRLLLWRHGQTEWNASGRFQGQLDPPLDEVGRAQAARTAPHLVASGALTGATVVVSSDLARARETAAALTGLLGASLRLDRRLREHQLGCWEGLTRAEVASRHPQQYADWVAGRRVEGRGGEDPDQVTGRALAAIADLPSAPTAVLVTHGGTAGRLIEALLGLERSARRPFVALANCAWSELVWHGERWRLVRHNNVVLQLAAGAGPEQGDDADAVR